MSVPFDTPPPPPPEAPSAPAGWYPEPGNSGVFRYWNGAGWEEWRQPAVAAPQAPAPPNGIAVTSLVFSIVGAALDLTIVGALLGFALALVGAACGEVAIRRARTLGRRSTALWGLWLGRIAGLGPIVILAIGYAASHARA